MQHAITYKDQQVKSLKELQLKESPINQDQGFQPPGNFSTIQNSNVNTFILKILMT